LSRAQHCKLFSGALKHLAEVRKKTRQVAGF
jgi:hypothetical protein